MENDEKKEECCRGSRSNAGVSAGGAYGLAFIGALVYYLQNAATFGAGVLGFLKALIWPAIVVYKILEFFS